MLEQKGYVQKRKENVPRNHDVISDNSSSTSYRRGTETKNILEFIHGGVEAFLHGTWDYFKSNVSSELIGRLFLSIKSGNSWKNYAVNSKKKMKYL